jgi:integrase
MNISYYIQAGKVNKKGATTVMLDLTWRGYRLQFSSGVMVRPENFIPNWPAARQPKNAKLLHTAEENALTKNWQLATLKLDLEKEYAVWEVEAKRQKDITPDQVRELVKKLTGRDVARAATVPSKPKPKEENIWYWYERWKHLYRNDFADSHLRRFLSCKKWLDRYHPELVLSELNEEWVQGYHNWLLENSQLRNGTIRIHLMFFRTMLRFARLPYEWLQVPTAENTPGVDLTYQEVLQLHQGQYPTAIMQHIVDAYVFLTQVGLRYGDYLALEAVVPVQTDKGEVLVILDLRQGKTRDAVTIPLTPLATKLWKKYKGQMPKYSNQEFNREIKLAARIARLTRKVLVTTAHGKEYRSQERPLYEIISAHTARHTCASLLLEASGGKELSQLTLGQSSRQSTNIYARHKQLSQIQQTLDAWDNLKKK